MKRILFTIALMFLVAPALRAADKDERVFEMRVYYAAPHKLDDLHSRFRDHTCKLFEKHGMKNIGYWQAIEPKDGKQVLIYILAHDSEEAAKKRVNRALDKLRAFLAGRGVTVSTAVLASLLVANGAKAPSDGLSEAVLAAVDDLNSPASVPYEAPRLQRLCGQSHGRSLQCQHMGQLFLAEPDSVLLGLLAQKQ